MPRINLSSIVSLIAKLDKIEFNSYDYNNKLLFLYLLQVFLSDLVLVIHLLGLLKSVFLIIYSVLFDVFTGLQAFLRVQVSDKPEFLIHGDVSFSSTQWDNQKYLVTLYVTDVDDYVTSLL